MHLEAGLLLDLLDRWLYHFPYNYVPKAALVLRLKLWLLHTSLSCYGHRTLMITFWYCECCISRAVKAFYNATGMSSLLSYAPGSVAQHCLHF